jgi:hypothetical protein
MWVGRPQVREPHWQDARPVQQRSSSRAPLRGGGGRRWFRGVVTAFAFRRAMDAFAVVKRHYDVVLRVGGGLLVLIGLLLVSGIWQHLVLNLQTYVRGFTPSI